MSNCPTQSAAKPYEVLIFTKPKAKKDEEPEAGEVLVKETIMAESDKHADIQAARMIPDAWAKRLSEVEVRVKLF